MEVTFQAGVRAPKPAMDGQLRRQMIATAAYLRAERRGFAPGSELQDWLEAEAEVDQKMSASPARTR